MPDQFDVFLSYNHADEAWVVRLKRALERAGLRVWRDKDAIRPGDVFPKEIAKAQRSSACICFVISRRSVESKWVDEEYNRSLVLAVEAGKRLIGLRLDEADLPDFLSFRHTVDFRDPKQFDEGIRQLRWGATGVLPLSALATDMSRPEAVLADTCVTKPVAEITWLRSAIQRAEKTERQFQLVRLSVLALGVLCGAGWLLAVGLQTGLPGIGAPLVAGLAGWGLTWQRVRVNAAELRRWSFYKEALEGCAVDEHPHPACQEIRDKFWAEVVRLTSQASEAVAA